MWEIERSKDRKIERSKDRKIGKIGKESMMTAAQLIGRMERFAVEVLKFTGPLLHAPETRDMARQLRRSAPGIAANYAAADIARSHADFTSKVGVALEEADESRRWLVMLRDAGLVDATATVVLIAEAAQLRAILYATHATARRNRHKHR
jgi:four helix bundle protein